MRFGLQDVSVAYGAGASRCQALQNVSTGLESEAINLVTGPSGSGKTTLLSLLGCLRTPDSGRVYFEGHDIGPLSESQRVGLRKTRIGFVFQSFRLFEALSAAENIALGAQIAGVGSGADRRRLVQKLLAQLDLESKADLKPDELSGGEKQRVAIARALVKSPSILLADEPSASLDSVARAELEGIFRRLVEETGMTIVIVSHDPRWEPAAKKKIVLRDGRLI